MVRFFLFIIIFSLPVPGSAEDQVNLYIKWFHQFQFAGFYMAQEKGYFADEGLKVNIIERDPKKFPTDEVLNNPGSYGISDSSLVLHYLKGSPFIIVAAIFQHSPLVLATREEDNIIGPEDLRGKKVMYQLDQDDAIFSALFMSVGLTKNDFMPIPHSFSIDSLIDKKVDAISIYRSNQPYFFKEKNIPIRMIDPSNYGIDVYGDLIFTTAEEALKFPKRVEAFRRASLKGWSYALKHPEEAIALTSRYSRKSVNELKFEADETAQLINADYINLGDVTVSRLEKIAKIYQQKERIKDLPELKNIIFDEFINQKGLLEQLVILYWRYLAIAVAGIILSFIFYSRKLGQEVWQKTNKLREANRQNEIFFSNVTHELRTPLNGIVGAAQVLKSKKVFDSESIELLDVISSSSQILIGLVNDLLDLAKMREKKFHIIDAPFAPIKLINDIQRFYKSVCRQKGIEFEVVKEIEDSLILRGDEIRLFQILHNLLSNAVKFTKVGQIQLTVRFDNELKFIVRDTGEGIGPENIGQLFRPFSQVGEMGAISTKGTGLGLSIVRELVELMGGTIKVESELKKGTQFEVSIPLSPTNYLESNSKLHELSCLVVDDNVVNRKVLGLLLKKNVTKVVAVDSGKKAIDKLNKEKFDIVFLDYFMPEMSGEECALRIQSQFKEKSPRLIPCSANAPEGHFKWDDFLRKPISGAELERCLNESFNALKKVA